MELKNILLKKANTISLTQPKSKVLKFRVKNTVNLEEIEDKNSFNNLSNNLSISSSRKDSRNNSLNKTPMNLTMNNNSKKIMKLYLDSNKESQIKISAMERRRRKIPNSIFSRFQREFNKSFNKTIKETKTDYTYIERKYKKKIHHFITPELSENKSEKESEDKQINIIEQQKINILKEKENDSFNNRQITFTEPSIIQSKNNTHQRYRCFRKYTLEKNILDKKWKIKYGLYNSTIKPTQSMNEDITYQSNSIKDNMRLFLDVFQQYKMYCLSQGIMLQAFRNRELNYQIHINQLLEETSSLLNLIPNIILKDYYDYKERFISSEEPDDDDFEEKIIMDESECLIENAKLINKIVDYIKPCFNVYIYLVNKDENDMIIPSKQFDLLILIFEKCRVYIGELLLSGKNSMKDLNFDRKLIKKYAPNMIKNYVNNHPEKKVKLSVFEKITSDYKFRVNDEAIKKNRINIALNSEKESDKRNSEYREKMAMMSIGGKPGPMSLINSNLMMRMLKYVNKDIREKIISMQTIERYQKQYNNKND